MDWSELPLDLLHLISKKLPDLSDFIRFRAVCKGWHSAALLTKPPPQIPWIVATRDSLPSTVRFYSLSSREIYSVDLPQAEGKRILGSSHHYTLAFDRKRRLLSLLNPLTRDEIPLPPTDSDWHRPLYIGSDPVQSGDDVVICWNSSGVLTVGSCRPGDREWKKIQIPGGVYGQTYYKGRYFVNERESLETKVMDIKTGATLSIIPPLTCASTGHPRRLDYLVMSSGELLGVSGRKWTCKTAGEYKFEVYRLDEQNEDPKWIKMDSIGDRVLFLDDTTGFCLRGSDFQGLKGNCIYYIAYLYPTDVDGLYKYPLCRYNLNSCRAEVAVPGGGMDMSSWFFPSI